MVGLPFPVYSGMNDSTGRTFKLRSTPTTILVSPKGIVLAVWEGAYGGETKSSIEKYFNVSLPPFIT